MQLNELREAIVEGLKTFPSDCPYCNAGLDGSLDDARQILENAVMLSATSDPDAPVAQTKLVIKRFDDFEGGPHIEITCAPTLAIGLRQRRAILAGSVKILADTQLEFYGLSWADLRAFAAELIARIDARRP